MQDERRFLSPQGAMQFYFLAKEGQASHCALADPGRIRSNVDPGSAMEKIGVVGECLGELTVVERVALELAARFPDMPVDRKWRPRGTVARGYVDRAAWSKCERMTEVLGGEPWTAKRYLRVLRTAYEKVTIGLVQRDLMDPPSWWDDELERRRALAQPKWWEEEHRAA